MDRIKYRENWQVIDISGRPFTDNVFVDFERGNIVIKHISTHAEYDKLTDL
ncbi:type II toxin-antitoxin system HigB family toxin [Enterobacter sp. BNK-32]|uniref:type II toxin-antitoxin system HigB family toxin n=1 Tax=Enterobacter TaxID=547 RepID=UPI002017FC84|nr:type II toxin-antitoxin system HigB family toxin [Enterobacter kobei]